MRKINVVPVSEARTQIAGLIEMVNQEHEPVFIAAHSKVKAVLLGIDDYNALIEELEDLEDSLAILDARASNEPARPFDEFMAELDATTPAHVRSRD